MASGERPASASCVSAPSDSAKPTPIATCGGTSQPQAAAGSSASAASPPAIRIAPQIARIRAEGAFAGTSR